MNLAEVVEVPLIVGEVLEADLAGEVAAVVPGMLTPLNNLLSDSLVSE